MRRGARILQKTPLPDSGHGGRIVAFVGLGSNLGDRAANLQAAIGRLRGTGGCQVVRVSPVYETEPVGPVAQGWFLNAAVECHVSLDPHALLGVVMGIERGLGRTSGVRWGPRIVDIDLLLYGEERIATGDLVVPHPQLWNRRFVLMPLLDVLPPGSLADRVARCLSRLPERPIVRLYAP